MASARGRDDGAEEKSWQELSSDVKKYAATHLNETEETRDNAVAEIKRWIGECDDLCEHFGDFLILRFLRISKFNLEETKNKILKYHKQLIKLPEWYSNWDPLQPGLEELLNLGVILPLRKPDDQGRLVVIMRSAQHNPNVHAFSDVSKVSLMGLEIAMKHYPAASVYGCSLFVDSSSATIRHIVQYRPNVLLNMANSWDSFPFIFQTINIFNVPMFFKTTVKLLRSFMSEELKTRFHVYSSSETTQECFRDVPASILPVEYGGTDGTIRKLTKHWKKLIVKNRDWFTSEKNEQIIISNH